MLSHGNIASNVAAGIKVLPIETGMIGLSILPLSHILERMADYSYLSMRLHDRLRGERHQGRRQPAGDPAHSSPPCRASSKKCARG